MEQTVQIPLKNSGGAAILDKTVYQELSRDSHLREIDFFANLRRHSSGCVVFQKTYRADLPQRGYRTETIYLHKLIAERYLSEQKVGDATLVSSRNGNKRDCRLDNLEYRSRSVASRKRRTSTRTGYTGVYQENARYRAVITVNGRSVHLGMFDNPEAAALAYNAKSRELFGSDGKINIVQPEKSASER